MPDNGGGSRASILLPSAMREYLYAVSNRKQSLFVIYLIKFDSPRPCVGRQGLRVTITKKRVRPKRSLLKVLFCETKELGNHRES